MPASASLSAGKGMKCRTTKSIRGAGECSFRAPMGISGRESTWPALAAWFELESMGAGLRKHQREVSSTRVGGEAMTTTYRVVESGEWPPQKEHRRAVSWMDGSASTGDGRLAMVPCRDDLIRPGRRECASPFGDRDAFVMLHPGIVPSAKCKSQFEVGNLSV
jgi:hypothetical protein